MDVAAALKKLRWRLTKRILLTSGGFVSLFWIVALVGIHRGVIPLRKVPLRLAVELKRVGVVEVRSVLTAYPTYDPSWADHDALEEVRACASSPANQEDFRLAIEVLKVHGGAGEAEKVAFAQLRNANPNIRLLAAYELVEPLVLNKDSGTVEAMFANPFQDVREAAARNCAITWPRYEKELRDYLMSLSATTPAAEQRTALSVQFLIPIDDWESLFCDGVVETWLLAHNPKVAEIVAELRRTKQSAPR